MSAETEAHTDDEDGPAVSEINGAVADQTQHGRIQP